jgi:hypothetical protein
VATLALELYFKIDGIEGRPDILGESVTRVLPSIRVRLDFPASAEGFSFMHAASAVEGLPTRDGKVLALTEHGHDLVEVRLVRVVVNGDFDELADDVDMDTLPPTFRELLLETATAMARDTCNWIRIAVGQDWMQPPDELPQLVSGIQLMKILPGEEHVEAERTITAPGGVIRVIPPEGLLDRTSVGVLRKHVELGAPPQEALLLADAKHLVGWKSDQASSDRAVLFAAMAIEIATKRTLRECATPEQAPLIELLIENPRDWSMSAHATFLHAVPLVARIECDDSWRSVARGVQTLFEARNKVVHRGESIAQEIAKEHVKAAVLAWDRLSNLNAAIGSDAPPEPSAAESTDAS